MSADARWSASGSESGTAKKHGPGEHLVHKRWE
jgi:hypothetical protein